MLSQYREILSDKKILLAYSAGVDSSALFHLLINAGIAFDIAIVDYGLREQSNDEVSHAKELATKYNLNCYHALAPQFNQNFEANARAFRYSFFEEIMAEHKYDILLTAHQLNDQLEWLLMRLTKGAGASELVGLNVISQKRTYQLMRPLLEYSKDELKEYLEANNHKYFIDSSNSDEVYERNYFRANFTDKLISKYSNGIKKSFDYLRDDIDILHSQFEVLHSHEELRVVKLYDIRLKAKAVDVILKELGYLLSNAQRVEVAQNDNIVISGKWAICIHDNLVYISPYTKITIPKETKERYRLLRIPPLIRGYCHTMGIDEIISQRPSSRHK
jgi:tRNA(Ile)-lysidine synthase